MKRGSFPWKKWKYLEPEWSRWMKSTRGDGPSSGEGMARETTIGEGGREG